MCVLVGRIVSHPQMLQIRREQDPEIINLLEQIFEQKEPNDCVKWPLSAEEMERFSWCPATSWGCDARTVQLPELYLKKEFTWNSCKRKNFDQDNDFLFNDELVFIARIPLAPNTTRISLSAYVKADSPTLAFVIFFQKRQSDLVDEGNPIDGKVFQSDGAFWFAKTNFDVTPDHDACFLYFVPTSATGMTMTRLQFRLDVAMDKDGEDLRDWLHELARGRFDEPRPSRYPPLLPIMLLRDGALALLGPDQEQNKELKNAFDMQGLDSTPQDLECIVDVCNVLLEASCEEL